LAFSATATASPRDALPVVGDGAELSSLAEGRRWHFFRVAVRVNGLIICSMVSLRAIPARSGADALRPSHIGRSILDHLSSNSARRRAKRYMCAEAHYVIVVFVLLPLKLDGLTMSPGVDSAAPWLLEISADGNRAHHPFHRRHVLVFSFW